MNKKNIISIAIFSLIGLFALLIIISFLPKNENGNGTQGQPTGRPEQNSQSEGSGERGSGERGERGGGERGERGGNSESSGRGERSSEGRSEGSTDRGGTERGSSGRGGGQGGGGGGGGGRSASAVRVTAVSPGTIERNVIINGEILVRNQVTIFPTISGRLVDIRRSVGDRVNRGDIIAYVDPSRPGEVYSHSPVISTVSGTILNAPYNIGDTISTQSGAFVVGDLSSLIIETHIAERFVASIELGMGADLFFEAIPGESFAAEVTEISPVLDPATRTMRIRLRFINPDSRIKAGMFATISLVTNRRADVPVIPRVSVISTYGSWIVFIVDENNIARRREVTLGIENEEFVEITGGLSLGDKVITAGQNFLSDGDSVRIVE